MFLPELKAPWLRPGLFYARASRTGIGWEMPARVVNPDDSDRRALGIGQRLQECFLDRHVPRKGVGMGALAEAFDRHVGEDGRLRIGVMAHMHGKDRPVQKGAARS